MSAMDCGLDITLGSLATHLELAVQLFCVWLAEAAAHQGRAPSQCLQIHTAKLGWPTSYQKWDHLGLTDLCGLLNVLMWFAFRFDKLWKATRD